MRFKTIRIRMTLRKLGRMVPSFAKMQEADAMVCERGVPSSEKYFPTPLLYDPFLQSVYNLVQRSMKVTFEREQILLQDGGNISLDWSAQAGTHHDAPIMFVMHGLTGGSEMNYVKALVQEADVQGYRSVCLNSRGINNNMTSPMPFTGLDYLDLELALDSVTRRHPRSPLYLVGTSFGGNYLLRYLIRNHSPFNIKALAALAPPINVEKVLQDIPSIYESFFLRRYVKEVVLKHHAMQFWVHTGVIDIAKVSKATTIAEFHEQVTAKILRCKNGMRDIYDTLTIKDQEMKDIRFKTLLMISKDDPIVSYESMPLASIRSNPNITLFETERGGHLCWYQGMIPKRWYPKPVFNYFKSIQSL